jgi:hypothetical protein
MFWTDPTNGKSDHPLAFKMKGTDKKLTNGKNIVKRRKWIMQIKNQKTIRYFTGVWWNRSRILFSPTINKYLKITPKNDTLCVLSNGKYQIIFAVTTSIIISHHKKKSSVTLVVRN